MKSLVAKSLLVVGLAAGLMVGGCDQKSGSGTGGGTTAPSGSTGSNSGAGGGGAKSLPGKVVETTKDVVNRANEAGAKVGEAAEQVGDTAMGAWADLRSKAASEGEKRLEGFKKKIQELQTTNPALFTCSATTPPSHSATTTSPTASARTRVPGGTPKTIVN